ncbi:MAG: hypothetical protein LCH77_17205, partial [Actinobacteria bacterium]|nr:hypothetical protein [Actinomycetota bacterium]
SRRRRDPSNPDVEHPDSEVGRSPTPLLASSARDDDQPHAISPSVARDLGTATDNPSAYGPGPEVIA